MTSTSLQNRLFIVLLLAFMTGFGITGCDLFNNSNIEEEEEIERSYSKSIERVYANEFERALIDSAEAYYPPRDSVISLLDITYSWRNNDNLIPENGYWYLASLDGLLQPYMINKDAISYYDELIDSLNSGSMQYIREARFTYESEISFHEEYTFDWPEELLRTIEEISGRELEQYENFENVYVVEMSLGWIHYCMEHCFVGFHIMRVAVLDESGKLLRIFMDGPWWIAMVS